MVTVQELLVNSDWEMNLLKKNVGEFGWRFDGDDKYDVVFGAC